jgi:hypothetical protein
MAKKSKQEKILRKKLIMEAVKDLTLAVGILSSVVSIIIIPFTSPYWWVGFIGFLLFFGIMMVSEEED